MPLPFNKNLDLKLIRLVQENPMLYNTKDPKYLSFDEREVLWQKIGDELCRPALICKTRWINIRDMMRRKIRDRIRNPNQRSYHYKYEDYLGFMIPYFKDSTPNHHEEYADFIDNDVTSCHVEMPAEVFVQSLDYDRTESKDTKPNITNLRNSKRSLDSSNERDFNASDLYQEMNPSDPIDVFLMSIGATLKKFTPYYLNQAKSKIFKVVQDYELEQIMSTKNQTETSSSTNR